LFLSFLSTIEQSMSYSGTRSEFADAPGAFQSAVSRQEPRSLVNVVESLYVIFALVYLTSPFVGVFTPPSQVHYASPGTVAELALQTFVYLAAGIFILRHWRSFVRGVPDCKWAIALVGLAMMSALWADDPLWSIRKGIEVAATTIFGIYFGTRYRRAEQVTLLCCALGMIAIMGTSMVLLFPEYGIDHVFSYSGAWRGVFETKNTFGKLMVLGALAAWAPSRKRPNDVLLRFAWVAGFAALVGFSRSTTAAVVGAALLVITLTYRALRSRLTVLVPTVVGTLLVAAALSTVFADHWALLLAALGRDSTFSGRTQLWDSVLVEIGKKPLLGYGFASFWHGLAGPSATVVIAAGWFPPHAHNGFLDLCLDLGVLGLLAFGIGFVLRFRTAILDYRAFRHPASLWPLAFLTFLLLYNLTESTLLRPSSLYWALYTASLVREVRAVGRWIADSGRAKEGEIEVDACPA
jgi:exopolysaccharide production protein ExoQ